MTTGDNEVGKGRPQFQAPVPGPPATRSVPIVNEPPEGPGFNPHFFRRDKDGAARVRIRFAPDEVALIEDAAGETPLLLFLHRIIGHECREQLVKREQARRAAEIESQSPTIAALWQRLTQLPRGHGVPVVHYPPFWHVLARLDNAGQIEYIVTDSSQAGQLPRQVFGPIPTRPEAADWARAARRTWFSDPVVVATAEDFPYIAEQDGQ